MDTTLTDEGFPGSQDVPQIENGGEQVKQQDTLPPAQALSETTTLKRVLPTRSRRGGPGIGSCDIDLTILDAQRRAEENKPLIPPSTVFLLVTDSTLLPPPADAADPLGQKGTANILYQGYFDRPETARAFQQQQLIETPVFTIIPPSDAVGSRLRARTGDEDSLDTSDGAYIARHRKYETFEKRQRRREKEKLVNEHQKLKARMEQLRSMDAAAFGGKDVEESERRRRTMLATAADLEQRYRVLLPEPRQRSDKKATQQTIGSDVEEESIPQPTKKLTIKISRPPTSLRNPIQTWRSKSEVMPRKRGRPPKSSYVSATHTGANQEPANRIRSAPQEGTQSPDIPIMNTSRRATTDTEHGAIESLLFDYTHSQAQSGESDGDPPDLSFAPSPSTLTDVTYSGRGRRPKRLRISLNKRIDAQVPSIQIAINANSTTCALLRQAQRTDPSARKTKRTHEPLGAKVGPRVEETSHYEEAMSDLLTSFYLEVKQKESKPASDCFPPNGSLA